MRKYLGKLNFVFACSAVGAHTSEDNKPRFAHFKRLSDLQSSGSSSLSELCQIVYDFLPPSIASWLQFDLG